MLIDNCKEIAALWRENAATKRRQAAFNKTALSHDNIRKLESAATLEQCAYLLETAVKNEENLK